MGTKTATGIMALTLCLISVPSGPSAAEQRVVKTPVVVTRSSSDLSAMCAPAAVAETAASFFVAVSEGAFDDAAALLAPARSDGSDAPFERYVFNIAPRFSTTDRSAVPEFLVARHAQGERIALRSAAVSRGRTDDTAFAAILIDRDAADVGHQSLLGKVGVNCSERSISALVVESVLRTPDAPQVCPVPRPNTEAIIACSTRGANAVAMAPGLRLRMPSTVTRHCTGWGIPRTVAAELERFNTGASAAFAALFAARSSFRPDSSSAALATARAIGATAAARYRAGEGWTGESLTVVRAPLPTRSRIRIRLRVAVTRALEPAGGRSFALDLDCGNRKILRWAPVGS